jgi:[acyl-carrier-protein] S-malonyltransferase
MMPWLAEDERVAEMRARLGVDDWRRSLDDPAWAANNANAQTLLTGLALAAWEQLAPMVPSPAAMDKSAAHVPGGLLAINGLAESALERLRADTGLALAIRNGIESVVLGGSTAALEQAQRMATGEGGQCTRLKVNVASHTPWMREAAERFAQTLADVHFESPHIVLFSNAGDRIRDGSAASAALAAQIAQTVRWDECMENIAARQVSCVLELGPGQALTRMWNQRYPAIPARACDDFRSIAAIASWLRAHSDD